MKTLVISRAKPLTSVRNYDPGNITMTFKGVEITGYADAGRLTVDRDPVTLKLISKVPIAADTWLSELTGVGDDGVGYQGGSGAPSDDRVDALVYGLDYYKYRGVK